MQYLELFGLVGTFGGLVSAAVFFGLRSYLGAYLSKKAEGLATKEDVEAITTIVESVKDEYAQKLAQLSEALRAQTSLRLLAAERRLEVHQQAYEFWGRMMNTIHSNHAERQATHDDLVRFWTTSCLYLDRSVREAFAQAMQAYWAHRDLLGGRGGPGAAQAVTSNFSRVSRLADVIVEACELPPIAGESGLLAVEKKPVAKENAG